jgi:hypothetical protein
MPEPRSKPLATKPSWHASVSLPGGIAQIAPTRWKEFSYRSFSPFAIELVCFDLRARRAHDVTLPFSWDTVGGQEALDLDIVSRYRPSAPQNREYLREMLIRARQMDRRSPAPSPARCELIGVRKDIYFPRRLRPLIEERWQELGYDGLSQYVTGLIRYDLILGGPHRYFSGRDTDPKLLAALDLYTIERFQAQRRQRILLDYLIEEAAGRELSDEERSAEMRRLAEAIRENAIRGRAGRHGARE